MEKIRISDTDAAKRLDIFLLEKLCENHTRSQINNFIKAGMILVNGGKAKSGYSLKNGDEIELEIVSKSIDAQPEDIDINIVYEDEHLIIVNKAAGMTVHAGAGNYSGTLVNALLHKNIELSKTEDALRPGIVHRLDKDTCGLMVVAKTNNAHAALGAMFEKHSIKRIYYALVSGVVKDESGRIETQIARNPRVRTEQCVVKMGGRKAITNFEVVERYARHTLVKFMLETGRTHQIRVHCKHMHKPVVGDAVYGLESERLHPPYQLLCSKRIEFEHPLSGKHIELEIDLPDYFEQALQKAKKIA